MKKLLMALMAMALLVSSCSRDNQNVTPAAHTSLGLVVPNTTQSSTNLILLKDGRTANPVSGIPDFQTMRAGSKLSLSYTAGTTHNGVVDIEVKNYALAKDSVFTLGPANTDTTSLTGVFKGTLNRSGYNSDSTSNQVELSFSGTTYSAKVKLADGSTSAVQGNFTTSGTTLDFSGWAFSPGTTHLVLNYFLHEGYLFMWAVINNEYISFTLNRNGAALNLFTGTFSGNVLYRIAGADSLSSVVSHSVSISFDGSNKYRCSGVDNAYPAAGSGTITITNDGVNTWIGAIEFKDAATTSDTVLNGTVHYQFSDQEANYLGLFVTRNGVDYSFYLHRN
jgi:hypothetical protein